MGADLFHNACNQGTRPWIDARLVACRGLVLVEFDAERWQTSWNGAELQAGPLELPGLLRSYSIWNRSAGLETLVVC